MTRRRSPGEVSPMTSLPRPEVVRCYHATAFHPHLPAMELRWDTDTPGLAEHVWHLPASVTLKGPAPAHFGITIHRLGPNSFRVRCLWSDLALHWERLTGSQIMASSLAQV